MDWWRKKKVVLVLFALALAILVVPVAAETVEGITLEGKSAAPFVLSYRIDGKTGGDLGELWQLTEGSATWYVYRTEPGSVPGDGLYRRVNLEERTNQAGKLRAILLEGYPNRDTEILQQRANAWLMRTGRDPVVQLQSGEALLAVQTAIWKLTQDHFAVENYLSDCKNLSVSLWESYLEQFFHDDVFTQQLTDHSRWNIQALCAYFESLSPAEPQQVTLTDAALTAEEYRIDPQGDGTYTVTVRFLVNIATDQKQELTLTAICGQEQQEQRVLRSGAYEFSFFGQTEKPCVTIRLSGYQQGGDVYFYESGDTRLIGFDQEMLPVCAETVLHPDRILRIYKNTPGEKGQPLANIQFNLYRTEEKDRSGSNLPTQDELMRYQTAENLVAIVSTDENGIAEYNFSAAGQDEGVYLVVEQFCAGTTGPVNPFYLDISASQWDMEIHLENTAETQPEIQVSVGKIGNNQGSFRVLEPHNWFIRASLPAGLSSARAYVITIPGTQWLQWNAEEAIVTLETPDGAVLYLAQNVHYIRQIEPELMISLTPAGMAYAAANGKTEGKLHICLPASMEKAAPMGVSLLCRVRVEYTNAAGIRYSKTSDAAQVHTGGLTIQKTDSGGKPLAGATFSLARDALAGEGNATFLQIGETKHRVVYVSFYADREKSGELVTQTQTNAQGRAWFSGLAYGTYYLVEISDANGMASEPQIVTVDATSHLDGSNGEGDHTLLLTGGWYLLSHLRNVAIPVLTAVGIAASLCACGLLIGGRLRKSPWLSQK